MKSSCQRRPTVTCSLGQFVGVRLNLGREVFDNRSEMLPERLGYVFDVWFVLLIFTIRNSRFRIHCPIHWEEERERLVAYMAVG